MTLILYSDKIYGTIFENTNKGIFGNYIGEIDDTKLYKVASIDEIKIGNAKILTVWLNGLNFILYFLFIYIYNYYTKY